ncbi:MAG: hypothetical protein Q8K86_08190 [Candidatus Nanopelagicaceae bacterium]|nr:hypothetical protein [Candidatus Nanopelagicaceae bacterium]
MEERNSVEISCKVHVVPPECPDRLNTKEGFVMYIEDFDREVIEAVTEEWKKKFLAMYDSRKSNAKLRGYGHGQGRPLPPPTQGHRPITEIQKSR